MMVVVLVAAQPVSSFYVAAAGTSWFELSFW